MYLFLYVVLAIAIIFVLLSLIAPRSYRVSRSVEIEKPLPEVFAYLKLVKNQDNWSPWKKKDPEMKQEFIGTDGEVGFISKWEGNKQVGIGEQEIKNIENNYKLETELRFFKPWKSLSNAFLMVDAINENNTKVTWGFSGSNPAPTNIFMLFFNFEKSVGKDFEAGLSDLKAILES
ncbi:SRPBCC family protein [Tamlana sp. 62-3]|uniref:SRPBCC family protein n=1 Tax=Neotamlana sargassicola TaxID=2883125 RepID=A0A9X1I6J3_9FLAO|nr:SRPBCC family protein [Tamlana sargassicola]MCB4808766.1 SRPBCC family protein [Tamlana sargassicola]